MNAIFNTSLIEGNTAKGMTIYVNETRSDKYPVILTHPPSPLGKPIFFSEEDAYAVHFPHNDTLVVTIHIGCRRVSMILVDGGSSVNILYEHTLDRMEETFESARKMIISQTQSLLYRFDGSEAHLPGTIEFPVRAIHTTSSQSSASLTLNLLTTPSSGGHRLT